MRTTTETRARVYDLDRAAKARFTEPIDRVLKVLTAGNVVRAKHRDHDADTLRRLIASCDRDIAAETAEAMGLGHQPRERAVGCTRCGAATFEPHAVCEDCGPQTCERCLPWGGAA